MDGDITMGNSHTNNHAKVYINADGQRVMRVTEVIRRLSKDQIAFWANMLGFKGISYKKELDRVVNIGSLAHDVIERYVDPRKLALVDYDAYGITEPGDIIEANRCMESLIKWYKGVKSKFKVLHTEYVVVGKSLGGTIDCIIEDWENPGKVIFVDWKSSGFYLSQFLQLAGYVLIYEEVHGKDTVGGVMVVAADKKRGERAQAKLLRKKHLKLFLHMFESLFRTAYLEKTLDSVYHDFLEEVY